MKPFKPILIILLSLIFVSSVKPQKLLTADDDNNYQKIGQEYAKRYFAPLTTGLGIIMGSGFIGGYSPLEFKKSLVSPHVYIGIKYCQVLNNKMDNSFDMKFKSKMTYLDTTVSVSWTVKGAPTVFGNLSPAVANGRFSINGIQKDTTVQLIGGSGVSALSPLYIPHIGIGTFFGTDFIIRGFPGVNVGSYGRLSLYGGSIRHNFSSYIKMPFDVALQGGFQNMKVERGGEKFLTANSYFFNIQFNKRLAFLSLYAGAQFEDYTMNVYYEYDGVKLPFTQKPETPFRAIFGLTLSIGPLKLNSDMSYCQKFAFTGGIGMGL
jgi:hypothetical protein